MSQTVKRQQQQNVLAIVYNALDTGQAKTLEELANELGMGYKSVSRYVVMLQKQHKVKNVGTKDKKMLYVASEPTIIPRLVNSSGEFASAISYLIPIAQQGKKLNPKLNQMCERWSMAFTELFVQANAARLGDPVDMERILDIKKYMYLFKLELQTRLNMVNELLTNEIWWTQDGLATFYNDPQWSSTLIERAWDALTLISNEPEKES